MIIIVIVGDIVMNIYILNTTIDIVFTIVIIFMIVSFIMIPLILVVKIVLSLLSLSSSLLHIYNDFTHYNRHKKMNQNNNKQRQITITTVAQ